MSNNLLANSSGLEVAMYNFAPASFNLVNTSGILDTHGWFQTYLFSDNTLDNDPRRRCAASAERGAMCKNDSYKGGPYERTYNVLLAGMRPASSLFCLRTK